MSVKEKILHALTDGALAIHQLSEPDKIDFMERGSQMIADTYRQGNKLLIAGNGGSLCDAMHCAEELTGVFRKLRPALPAISLSDPGHLTCVSNDLGFDQVFARGIEAFGKPGDIFIGLTTSGNSSNLILAFEQAKKQGLQTLALLGKGGGRLKGIADLELIINGFTTSDRIQEAHMMVIHILIELVEDHLFYSDNEIERIEEECVSLAST